MKRILVVLLVLGFGLGVLGCSAEQDTKPAAKPAVTQSKSSLVDINSATADELIAIKGIGEARAKAIIKGRPYARKDELVQRKIIPQSVYDDIKDQIIARQK
ncbi:MAG TPA: helix-hairpin-helix domain-containing protein [Burkholderiales bacterium]|nr:helix-hairpin-helix domain-containing protein [Burkholderiales bacterium]